MPGSIDGGNRYGNQFIRFLHQTAQPFGWDQTGFDQKFHPIRGFIGLLFHKGHLGDEIRARLGSAGGSVVRSDART